MVTELAVLDELRQLITPDADETAFCDTLCRRSLEKIRRRLKEDADESDPRVISAAAARAYFTLLLRRHSDASRDFSAFKAGDLSISQSSSRSGDKLLYAGELCAKTEAELAPLLEDPGFYVGKIDV